MTTQTWAKEKPLTHLPSSPDLRDSYRHQRHGQSTDTFAVHICAMLTFVILQIMGKHTFKTRFGDPTGNVERWTALPYYIHSKHKQVHFQFNTANPQRSCL